MKKLVIVPPKDGELEFYLQHVNYCFTAISNNEYVYHGLQSPWDIVSILIRDYHFKEFSFVSHDDTIRFRVWEE